MITITEEAYTKFLKFSLEYANPNLPSSSWQETIGFLFGKFIDKDLEKNFNSNNEVLITDVLPMDSGSSVYVKIGDYSLIYETLIAKGEKGEFIVGWIHSHPGLSIFLSGTDVSTQSLYQKMDERSVAIVVDPTTIRNNFPGMKAFRVKNHSYYPLELKVDTKRDFSEILNTLITELVVIRPPQRWAEKLSFTLDNIILELEGPNIWDRSDSIIHIMLKYRLTDPGLLIMHFKPSVYGAQLIRPFRKTYRIQLYDKDVVVFFGLKPEINFTGSIRLELNNITLFGKTEKKEYNKEIIFNIQNVK